MPRKDIAGLKFGRLTALRDVGSYKNRTRVWLFQCDCGKEHTSVLGAVTSGNTISCGCAKIEATKRTMTTHGLTTNPDSTKAYNAWLDIHRKCYNPKSVEYVRYGAIGRGIQDSWFADPTAFVSYVLSLPDFDHTKSLDRVDNDKGYEEGNLRWATAKQQARNRKHYSDNPSGKSGVEIRVVTGNTYTTAHWHDLVTGKCKSKNFSVKKLGLLPAVAEAVKFREKMIAQLNEQGAGYSDKHGK